MKFDCHRLEGVYLKHWPLRPCLVVLLIPVLFYRNSPQLTVGVLRFEFKSFVRCQFDIIFYSAIV